MKTRADYTSANRKAWNEAMPKHQAANQDKWDTRFAIPGYTVFEDPELEQLQKLDVTGKSIAHTCCNNGVELMSLKNMGAGRCVGFDISDAAIDEAAQRASRFLIECEFVRTDVYEIDPDYNGQFDIVYISIGCIGWLPDLQGFLARISQLLNEGGRVFIHEQHPFVEMLSQDSDPAADPLKIIEPYFKSEPYEEHDGIDYIGKTTYDAPTKYWFVWTLSDILRGVINAGLHLKFFEEYPKDISASHQRNEEAGIAIPMSYILIAQKPQALQSP